MLGIKPRVSSMLGKHTTNELNLKSYLLALKFDVRILLFLKSRLGDSKMAARVGSRK
jgi:hypothetical protein